MPLQLVTLCKNNHETVAKASLGATEIFTGTYLLTRRTAPHVIHIIGIGFVGDGTQRLYHLFVNQRFDSIVKTLETYKENLATAVQKLATTNKTSLENGKSLVQLQQSLADFKKQSQLQLATLKKQADLLATRQHINELKIEQKKNSPVT